MKNFTLVKNLNRVALFTLAMTLICMSQNVSARPEYSVRYAINRCTACHFSPAGGGPRNLNGKYFGAFGHKSESWIQNHDVVGIEAKFLYYKPEDSKEVKGGLGVMLGSVWGSLPIQSLTNDTPEIRLVAEQNMGGFGAGPRQWYLRWTFDEDTQTSFLPQYFLFGRIISPFGLMTDEHRSYVRMQSGTSWNTGLDMGLLLAANPTDNIHYDFAIFNGKKNLGTAPASEMADIWGGTLNLRYLSAKFPISFGVSHSYYPATSIADQSTATSLYTIFSFHRMTNNRVPISLSAEIVQATNWNDSFSALFVSDPNYLTSIAKTKSRGYYFLTEWNVSEKLIFQYKFDQLELNQNFPSDSYLRHGLGFKYLHANNLWSLIRYEKAIANQPNEKYGLKIGAQDALWILMNISI